MANASGRIDPLKADPTRTAGLRRSFMAAMTTRLTILRKRIIALVEGEDAFGLARQRRVVNVESPTINERWSFRTTPEQLEEFEDWLREQYANVVLDADNPDAYFQEFIRRGYEQGAGRAFADVNPAARGTPQFYAGTRDQFLRTAFAQPIAREKVKLLTGRVLTELKGVSQGMATRMMRTLADGLVRGESPRDVARRLTAVLDGDVYRAHTIARTETIRAHAEGQLDALELMGVEEVGVAVEWSTAKLRVCPLCQALDGITLSIRESRGMIPRHVNCRCSWIPANVGEADPKQIRTKRGIDQAIRESIRRELPASKRDDAKALKARVKDTPWTGADASVSETRPKSILDD